MASPFRSSIAAPVPLEGDLVHSAAGERFAAVLETLLSLDATGRQILVTSPSRGDGKTLIASNLALAFRARHVSVLLVELALRHPQLRKIFGDAPSQRGMDSVLRGDCKLEDILCLRNDNGLHLAMAGSRPCPDDLLAAGEALDAAIEAARARYAWTIFDGPSMESDPEIAQLARKIGLVLVVARRRKTRVEAVRNSLRRLRGVKTLVLLNEG